MKSNKKSRDFVKDEAGNIEMITMALIAGIMFAISIPIIFNVISSLNISTVDADLQTALGDSATTPAANATNSLLTQIASFYSIGPIYIIVLAAVGIIAAILVLRRFSG